MKKIKNLLLKPTFLIIVAALLILGSGVQSARASLSYYSDHYKASMDMSTIGVSLLENEDVVSMKTYDENGNAKQEGDKKLLQNLVKKDESFALGKAYDEKLSVKNDGNIDTFVRVILTKSWQDQNGKNVDLDPSYIQLGYAFNDWVINEAQYTNERVVLYYTKALEKGKTTPEFTKTIRIDPVLSQMFQKIKEGNKIEYKYTYDGYTFTLEAEVDAIQTHNAKDAIKSAWGIDVNVNDEETKISLE